MHSAALIVGMVARRKIPRRKAPQGGTIYERVLANAFLHVETRQRGKMHSQTYSWAGSLIPLCLLN